MDEQLRALERRAAQGDDEAGQQLERARARAGLHETSAAVLEALGPLEDGLADARRAFRTEGMEDLDRWLRAAFAAHPGLQALRIRGYTPGFLDGDLCEHSQSVLLGKDEYDDDDDFPQQNDLPPPVVQALTRALGEFEPVLELRHGTNWQLTVTRGPDGPLVEKSDYTSGY